MTRAPRRSPPGAPSGALLVLLALVAATPAAAQQQQRRSTAAAPTRACAPLDTAGEWHRAQRTWLDESKHDWSSDSLRALLVGAAGVDAARPVPVQIGVEVVPATSPPPGAPPVDSAVRARILATAADRQAAWFGRSVVGPAGVRALWLLAARDTSIERQVLHRMMEAGPDESLPADVATMEDRVRVHAGRKQVYGTQLHTVPGRAHPEPFPIEDPSHVDLRRDAAGLPPLKAAICELGVGGRR